MGHTPGPWAVENDEDTLDQWFIREPEGGIVAVLEKGPNEEIQDRQYDNARLIAAAPDLLEVCKELLEEHYLFRKNNRLVCPFCMTESIADCPVNFPHSPDCPVLKARQVIAKAEGREA